MATSLAPGLAALRSSQPAVADRLERMRELSATALDPALVELARHRLAALLGCQPEPPLAPHGDELAAQLAELAAWPTSPRFGPRERAVLAFTEQFVIDVSATSAADVDALLEHLAPGEVYGLVLALQVLDGRHRIGAALGALFDEEPA